MSDQTNELQDAISAAYDCRTAVHLIGGGSKAFLGNPCPAADLSLAEHKGIINYEPTELVVTARAGTPLGELKRALAENNQALPFEPPAYAESATLGGTLACGLSGPARPYAGAARDMVLGTRVINGKGEVLRFGGEVMKNVAGYDLSRLMVGSHGTLGVILEASLKVLPRAPRETTLSFEVTQGQAITQLNEWAGHSLPITASAWFSGQLHVRLGGAESAVAKARQELGGEPADNNNLWGEIAEHQVDFFRPLNTGESLWRISLPQTTAPLDALDSSTLIEWGGGQRWIISQASGDLIRESVSAVGGHATRFRSHDGHTDTFQPPTPALMKIHQNIKLSMDPEGIFNPGVLYPEL